MHIDTEKEISGNTAKQLRETANMGQREFWEAVGVRQSVGCRYEAGRRIPRPVRILLFARFVAGLPIDASSPEGATHLRRLAWLNVSEAAISKLREASQLLTSLN